MPAEPADKRAIVFIDGQNLFHAVKTAFGYAFPNYDVLALSKAICAAQGWHFGRCRFYTGLPDPSDNAHWHHFWTAKTARMGRQGVIVYTRPLRYRNKQFHLPDGNTHTILVGEEKGVDVRFALDVVRLTLAGAYDVALVFSQDQDLSEVADDIKAISIRQNRWLKMASAFPVSPIANNKRGIARTHWAPFDRATYEGCIDPRDYRRKRP